MTYQQKLRSKAWRKKRDEVIRRACGKCEDCGYSGPKLEAHHCAYIPRANPEDHGFDLLICVCPACHVERQKQEDAIRITWGKICRHTPPAKLKEAAWFIMEYCAAIDRAREAVKVFGGDT